jgi:large subunit ribosomal protein L35
MPKLKTNRGTAKRFKLTGTGKVRRRKAFKNHILTKKSSKRKRNLGQPTLVSASDRERIKRLLPYG